MTYSLDWNPVRTFVSTLGLPANLPIAGTTEWVAADDDEVRAQALVIAGSRWVLEQELLYLRERRAEMKLAAIEIAQAKTWTAVARQLRDRDAFLRDNSDWAIRKVAS